MIRRLALVLITLAVVAGCSPAAAGTLTAALPLGTPGVVLATPQDAALVVDHPTRALRYEVLPDRDGRHVLLRTTDRTDPGRPAVIAETPLHAVTAPRSVAIDRIGSRLYVAVGTNTHVLDLTDPTRPVQVGRMADYMVRTHQQVQTATVDDPSFGRRDLLLISSRLGGGEGCWTGTVHVYDTTGALRDTPVQVLESDVPLREGSSACVTPTLRVHGSVRRLSLTWSAGEVLARRDLAPYDVTPAYASRVGVCLIV